MIPHPSARHPPSSRGALVATYLSLAQAIVLRGQEPPDHLPPCGTTIEIPRGEREEMKVKQLAQRADAI